MLTVLTVLLLTFFTTWSLSNIGPLQYRNRIITKSIHIHPDLLHSVWRAQIEVHSRLNAQMVNIDSLCFWTNQQRPKQLLIESNLKLNWIQVDTSQSWHKNCTNSWRPLQSWLLNFSFENSISADCCEMVSAFDGCQSQNLIFFDDFGNLTRKFKDSKSLDRRF